MREILKKAKCHDNSTPPKKTSFKENLFYITEKQLFFLKTPYFPLFESYLTKTNSGQKSLKDLQKLKNIYENWTCK